MAARERVTGSRKPNTVGGYPVAAFFAAVGACALVFGTDDVTATGSPVWLLGGGLVLCGVGLAVAVHRRL